MRLLQGTMSYTVHTIGGLAGFLVGTFILENRKVNNNFLSPDLVPLDPGNSTITVLWLLNSEVNKSNLFRLTTGRRPTCGLHLSSTGRPCLPWYSGTSSDLSWTRHTSSKSSSFLQHREDTKKRTESQRWRRINNYDGTTSQSRTSTGRLQTYFPDWNGRKLLWPGKTPYQCVCYNLLL